MPNTDRVEQFLALATGLGIANEDAEAHLQGSKPFDKDTLALLSLEHGNPVQFSYLNADAKLAYTPPVPAGR